MTQSRIKKVSLLGILVFSLLFAATWGYHQYAHSILTERIETEAEKNHDIFSVSLSLVYNNMLQLATFVANDKAIQQLFRQGKLEVDKASGDFFAPAVLDVRDKMINRLQSSWAAIQGRFYARQLHFHLGPGSTSFLRLHKLNKFGDRMDTVRYTIVDTNKELTPRVGFETGRIYSGLRGVVPMFADVEGSDQPVHVGALEAGTSFKNIIELLKKHLHSDISIALKESHIKLNMWPGSIEKKFVRRQTKCNCFIEATTSEEIVTILNTEGLKVPETGQKTSLIELGEKTVAVTYFALRDYRGTRNPELDTIGGIFIWWDVTPKIEAFHLQQIISSTVAIIAFLLSLFGINMFLERREIMDKQKRLMRELSFQKFALDQHAIVSATNPSGEIIYANDKFCETSEYSREELLGHNHRILKSDKNPAWIWKSMWSTITRGNVWHGEVQNLTKSGTTFWMAATIVPFLDENGDPEEYISIRTDITERKKAEEKLKNAFKIITESIDYAAHIQRSILPPKNQLSNVFSDYFIIWEPRDKVGGDIYWCPSWGRGQLIILADCTGHGVPGAFVTLIATGALERALEVVPVGDVACLLHRMHQHVQLSLGQQEEDDTLHDDGLELGLCYIDPDKSRVTFSGARFSLFYLQDGETKEIKGDKAGIGYRLTPLDAQFTSQTIDIKEITSFYLTSDGLIDQIGGPRRRMFGKKRFRSLLEKIQHLPMDEQKAAIVQELADYQGTEIRRDDVSVIGFKI